uniref:HMA domain-containing protein n=1 Tax=Fagus sylvatica TaxID=28930 RepID=A0A2N9J9L6_FAGSY
MEYQHVSSPPICILKVEITCCDECPIKLKKKLLKTNGVTSVEIDSKKGTVKIIGDIDPTVLIQMFDKMGKPAELLFFEKSSSQKKSDSNVKKKVQFACDDDEHVSKRGNATRTTMHGNKHGRGWCDNGFGSVPPSSSSRFYPRTPRPVYRTFPNPIWHRLRGSFRQPPPLPSYGCFFLEATIEI